MSLLPVGHSWCYFWLGLRGMGYEYKIWNIQWMNLMNQKCPLFAGGHLAEIWEWGLRKGYWKFCLVLFWKRNNETNKNSFKFKPTDAVNLESGYDQALAALPMTLAALPRSIQPLNILQLWNLFSWVITLPSLYIRSVCCPTCFWTGGFYLA